MKVNNNVNVSISMDRNSSIVLVSISAIMGVISLYKNYRKMKEKIYEMDTETDRYKSILN